MHYLDNNKFTNLYDIPDRQVEEIGKIIDMYFAKISMSEVCEQSLQEIVDTLLVLGIAFPFLKEQDFWEEISYKLMLVIRESLWKNKGRSLGLIEGMANIGSVINIFYENTGHYKKFMDSFNELFCDCLENNLQSLKKTRNIKTSDFDSILGISGSVQYLLKIKDLQKDSLLDEAVDYLYSLVNYKEYKSCKIPGWYISKEGLVLQSEKEKYPNGLINFSLSHGIVGPLSTLVKLGEKGIQKNKVDKAIDIVLAELERVKWIHKDNNITYYPGILELDDYINNNYSDNNIRMSWCYGSVGTLCILYKAYKYKNNVKQCKQVVRELETIAKLGREKWYLESPIICHGFAGTAQIFKVMFEETESEVLRKAYEELLESIIQSYNEQNKYCFRDVLYRQINGKYEKVYEDKNTFLEGGAGIIAILLGFLKKQDESSQFLLLK